MAVNKVEYGDTTLIDLTSDTVTKETLLIGATAHTASGESISGEFDPEIYLRKSGGDTTNNIVTFTSGDSTSPTAWTDVNSLVTGEKHSSLLNKISTMIKNVRFLYKVLGTTDISTIGDGTVTGAVSTLNSSLKNVDSRVPVKFIVDNQVHGNEEFTINRVLFQRYSNNVVRVIFYDDDTTHKYSCAICNFYECMFENR